MRALRLLIVAAGPLALAAAAGSSRAERQSAPVPAKVIAAGLAHTCALTSAGGVKCWGYNGHDELGNGSFGDSSTPTGVTGLSRDVSAISVGVRHSCALTSAGGVKCWGFNRGALGDGTPDRRFTPVDVAGLAGGVVAVAAGNDSACALLQTGAVKCWDRAHLAPVDIPALAGGVRAIAAGSGFARTCALTTAGGVKCWGDDLTPRDVTGLSSGVTAITSSCVLTSSGGVECWGKDLVAADVPGLGGGVQAIASSFHTCALLISGGVKCWGLNEFGELGDGTKIDRATPVDVVGLKSGVTAIAAGSFDSCALTKSGAVRCWGANGNGQLGDGTTVERTKPVDVIGFGTAKPTVAIVLRSVTVTPARVAAIGLRCGAGARCRGTLTVTSGHMKLGSRPFSIAPGAALAVPVKLTPSAFERLTRARRLSAHVAVRGAATASRTITLLAP